MTNVLSNIGTLIFSEGIIPASNYFRIGYYQICFGTCLTSTATSTTVINFTVPFTLIMASLVNVNSTNSAGSGLDGCYIACTTT